MTGKTDRETWRTRLKAARNAAGLSQRELSGRMQIPQSTYAAYEAGQNEPDLNRFQQIAAELEVAVEWLVFGAGDPPEKVVALLPNAVDAPTVNGADTATQDTA